jgi:hypothetical protein
VQNTFFPEAPVCHILVCFVKIESEAKKTNNDQWQHSLHGNAVTGHQQLNTNGVWHGTEKHNEHKKTVDRQTVDKMDFEKPKNQNVFKQRGTDETEKCVVTMAILANRLLRARKRNQGNNKNITVLSRHYCVTRLIIRKIKKETEGVWRTEHTGSIGVPEIKRHA